MRSIISRLAPAFLLALVLLIVTHGRAHAQACCGGAPLVADCNVGWVADDSLAACPAGDSLIFSHSSSHRHPSKLRMTVHYEDNFCNFKVKVPPESIYVTYQIISGNLRVNDKGAKIFADDSTDAGGSTRITIPSFSGCGKVRLRLNVSGKTFPFKDRIVS